MQKSSKLQFKIQNFIITFLLLITFNFALLSSNLSEVKAQTILPLTVAPARQELAIKPGEKSAFIVKFLNQGTEPVSGILKVADFIVEDKEGSPTFLEGPTQLSPRFAAASWVKLPYDRITIPPKDKVLIQAKITAPEDAQAGGRYLAVYFEPSGTPGEATGAEKEAITPVATRIAALVYIRVAGPVEEKAYITQLTVPRFLEYGPIPVRTEILNRGNYHIRPKGILTLTSIFGKKIDEQLIQEQNIFPDASRLYKNELGEKWMFGKYKIELTASYGETGKVLNATVFTWVFPWKAALAVVLGVIIIILLAWLLWHKIKRREEALEEKVEELEEKLEEKSE